MVKKISEIYSKKRKSLINLAYQYVKDYEVAEEMAAQAYEKALKYQSYYNPSKSTLFTWLANIQKNECLAYLKYQKRYLRDNDTLNNIVEENKSDESIITFEEIKNMLYTIKQIKGFEQIWLDYYMGHYGTFEDMSNILGIKSETLKTKFNRTKNELKKKIIEKKSVFFQH